MGTVGNPEGFSQVYKTQSVVVMLLATLWATLLATLWATLW